MYGEHRTHPIDIDTVTVPDRPQVRGPRSPAEVREAVRHAFEGARRSRPRDTAGGDEAVGDALLVASELTTNAMLHGGGVTRFEVTLDDRDVRLSVSDRSQELPRSVRRVDEQGFIPAGGHGWPIVCRLSRDITISELDAGGKRITAVVPLAPR
ncbi:ATP-binding protein [Streptomyces sp. NBC_00878]|uniref:ATP-binding protein n=1 Tax=Streptomyces sp. NBC_00878 TaxID=2975854 RepID=UPI00225AB000|nr:ATP-binding protein [Streptomyces sp. NBC_00878]MCX4902961.1 ATP-binding protein [Streptomyces sp. NBC_00878]